RASEALRLPVDAAHAVRGADLDAVRLSYLFQRTTGDDPFQRDLQHGPWSAENVYRPGDAESTIDRVFEGPASRRFAATAWVSVSPQVPDYVLDRLAGYRGGVRASSSSRFDSEPQWRASSALDGDPRTAWIGDYQSGRPAWIQWHTPSTQRIRT